jgi:FkbM family methyltransferase
VSRFDRAAGIARSLAIYHGIPLRQRRLRRLYRHFVERGDLAFDIGAHAGNRARALAALGCRVVAVEPQPDFVKLLRALFARGADLVVVNAAVGQAAGRTQLSISERTPTVTTVADAWREARADEPDFERVRWTRTIDVEMTTLDLLIARFGVPRFVKIDVEGSELAVLSGLTDPVAGLSFEYLPRALDQVRACVDRLATLGDYRFNYSPGESYELAEDDWITGRELVEALSVPDRLRRSGDVYARAVKT